jgi:hypothetical protein
VRRAAADVLLLGAVRERVEPDLLPRGEGSVRVERKAGQCKKQGTTVNVYPASPPSSSWRRLHRRPNVSRPAALPFFAPSPSFESLPVSTPSSR